MKKIQLWIYIILFLAMLITAVGLILSAYDTPLKFRIFGVKSGSMEPAIKVGSVIIVKNQKEYQVGNIVTVKAERNTKDTFTHRIAEIIEDKETNKISYRTKGDANEEPDGEPITSKRVVGKVVLSIPFIGYFVAFAQTRAGLIILVIIPAALIIYSELANIKNEILKLWTANTKKKKLKIKTNVKTINMKSGRPVKKYVKHQKKRLNKDENQK